ncbi:hypothetical protein HDU96_008702 [Phlyctochytrium bullatum]|nr:hypothetical protein HDU96_008702 [Phlyctochytrium bullatum]
MFAKTFIAFLFAVCFAVMALGASVPVTSAAPQDVSAKAAPMDACFDCVDTCCANRCTIPCNMSNGLNEVLCAVCSAGCYTPCYDFCMKGPCGAFLSK